VNREERRGRGEEGWKGRRRRRLVGEVKKGGDGKGETQSLAFVTSGGGKQIDCTGHIGMKNSQDSALPHIDIQVGLHTEHSKKDTAPLYLKWTATGCEGYDEPIEGPFKDYYRSMRSFDQRRKDVENGRDLR